MSLQAPEEVLAFLETIDSTTADIVRTKEKRISLAKYCDSDYLEDWDRSIRDTENALRKLERLAEPARLDVQHNGGRIAIRTRLKLNLKKISVASQSLDLARNRMMISSLIPQMQQGRDHSRQNVPQGTEETSRSHVPHHSSTKKAIRDRRREERERLEASEAHNTVDEQPATSEAYASNVPERTYSQVSRLGEEPESFAIATPRPHITDSGASLTPNHIPNIILPTENASDERIQRHFSASSLSQSTLVDEPTHLPTVSRHSTTRTVGSDYHLPNSTAINNNRPHHSLSNINELAATPLLTSTELHQGENLDIPARSGPPTYSDFPGHSSMNSSGPSQQGVAYLSATIPNRRPPHNPLSSIGPTESMSPSVTGTHRSLAGHRDPVLIRYRSYAGDHERDRDSNFNAGPDFNLNVRSPTQSSSGAPPRPMHRWNGED